ncbi:protein kinase [Leptolyngbya sp. FACHB-711]|uniref:protein kinase domain-containing protein n=1 Tax=unclassified Leptolyngbya TaxID=2650499 RepID=UPI001688CD75|nr:serine/threonine protein kinase [Cyanobacteria bacterium FACHB-502]MBD2027217.1 serine/threonine protein kinase [Leptolyngbya sp. FACHB-711]
MAKPLESEPKRSKYRLLGLVGQGQFGRVFCGAHRQTGQLAALKDLDRHRFPTAKFLRELRFLLSLQHPNIVMFQAVEHTATGRYLVMDYCEGGTLRSLIAEEGGLSFSQSLKLVIDILAGLEHAHARQIVHCDIKPENILLNVTSIGWTARISDFGIARLNQELDDHRLSNTNSGSPAYMAPERFYGQFSPISDLYAVGVLLYELLVGHRPFSGTPAELMTAHLNHPVTFPASFPEVWKPILVTALQKLSARRFRSAQEMREAILSIARAADLLDSTAVLPLLKPVTLPCSTAFHAQSQETLRSPVTALCATANQLQTYVFRGSNQQAAFQAYQGADPLPTTYIPCSKLWQLARLPSPIIQLACRPQGCFVVAEKALYLICPEVQAATLIPQQIRSLLPFSQVVLEAKGRWLAVLAPNSHGEPYLCFERLSQVATQMQIVSDPMPISLPGRSTRSSRIFALDAHHVAILTDIDSDGDQGGLTVKSSQKAEELSHGTEVQIFCRRGLRIGALMLPLRLGATLVTSKPYRLLAVDRDNPGLVALLDLKPYRILRISVDITPIFLATAPWGYLLSDQEGKIVLLDVEGQKVGCLIAPEPITAITALEQHQVAIATWNGSQGSLYTVNLKDVDVDLIF